MDRFAEKQAQIDQRRAETCARYPELWSNMIMEWNSPGSENRAWLMYSANYLFRTNNVRWRLKDRPQVNAVQDLEGLSFVLLTHSHNDHLDTDLLDVGCFPVTRVLIILRNCRGSDMSMVLLLTYGWDAVLHW